MTVESLIKSAIADEVNAKLDPKTVKEIVDKKVQRLAKKTFASKDISIVIAHEVREYLKSWEGQKLIRSVIAELVTISLTKE
jgi:ATP-dependent Clp protease ATP-binding subunit ClpA